MKKILGILITFAIGSMAALSAKTWTNIAGFGWNIPMDFSFTSNEYKNGEEIVLKNQTGIEGFYIGVHKNGFAVKGAADVNFSGINHEMDLTPYTGINVNLQLGAGFSPWHSERFTFGIFGMIGIDASAFYAEKTAYNTQFSTTITSKYTEGYIGYMLGGNITTVYTPASCFSLFASCSVNYVTPGVYLFKAEYSDIFANSNNTFETNGTMKIIPTIGVCWKF